MIKREKCCLCKKNIRGWGNNAAPLKDGRCCGLCNSEKVIPARLEAMKASQRSESHE